MKRKTIHSQMLIIFAALLMGAACSDNNAGGQSINKAITVVDSEGDPLANATLWTQTAASNEAQAQLVAPLKSWQLTDSNNGATCEDPPQSYERAACTDGDGEAVWICSGGVRETVNVYANSTELAPITFTCTNSAIEKVVYSEGSEEEDASTGGLYVTAPTSDALLDFNQDDDGDVEPFKFLSGAATLMDSPSGIAIANNALYVANLDNNSITGFLNSNSGNVSPTTNIVGAATTLSGPRGLDVDLSAGEIFVANQGANSIVVFSQMADGNMAPIRTIAGALTGLSSPYDVAVSGSEIFVSNTGGNSILVFSSSANGNVAPIREISGLMNSLINSPRGIDVDGTNIFVVNGTNEVNRFLMTDNGDVAAQDIIKGSSTLLDGAFGLSVHSSEIFVTNTMGSAIGILVFSSSDSGDTAPKRVIAGSNTNLTVPLAVEVDPFL